MSWQIDLGGEPELCVSVVDFALTALGSGLWAAGGGPPLDGCESSQKCLWP
jgi:hypothetical protein